MPHETGSDVQDEQLDRPTRSLRAMWIRRAILLVLAIACARIIIDLVGTIDWHAVWDGIDHLHAWQLALLVGLVVVRQTLNAMPLAYFIPGLSVFRATASDQGATLMSMVAPPTTDHVFRLVVLRSWGIDLGRGAAGGTGNILVFYIARWIAPLVGVLLLAPVRVDLTYLVVAAASLVVAVALLVGGFMVTRSQPLAEGLGRWTGGWAARVRRSIDPEAWAAAFGRFQTHIADRFKVGVLLSLPTLVVKLVVDALICLCAIRFVGIGSDQLPAVEVVVAFLVVFPLTLFPLQGIGLLDATLVAALTDVGGVELEAGLVAAMVTYRVVTLGVPALLGLLFILGWRHTTEEPVRFRSLGRSSELPK
jgi:putative heme transporter